MLLQTCAVKAAPKVLNGRSKRAGANQCACGPIVRRAKAGRRNANNDQRRFPKPQSRRDLEAGSR